MNSKFIIFEAMRKATCKAMDWAKRESLREATDVDAHTATWEVTWDALTDALRRIVDEF